jgi:hypothetical protein
MPESENKPPSKLPELLNHSGKHEASFLRRSADYFQEQGHHDYARHLREKADKLEAQHEEDEKMTPKEFAAILKGKQQAKASAPAVKKVEGGRVEESAKPRLKRTGDGWLIENSSVSPEALARARAQDGKWLRERLSRDVPIVTPRMALEATTCNIRRLASPCR